MKAKTLIIIAAAAAAAAGCIIAKDKAQKETVKWLVVQDAFKDYDEKSQQVSD